MCRPIPDPIPLPTARAVANRSRDPGASSSPPPDYTRLSQSQFPSLSVPWVAPAANDAANDSAAAVTAHTGRAPPGTPPAATDDGYTALTGAVNSGHLEVTRLLLDRPADPNQGRTDDGCTALLEANAGRFDAAQLLLDRLANPNRAATDDGVTRAGTGWSGDSSRHQ